MIDVVVCRTGVQRHAPDLAARLPESTRLDSVECFDRCDTCERFLLARVAGATMRFRNPDELLQAVQALGEAE